MQVPSLISARCSIVKKVTSLKEVTKEDILKALSDLGIQSGTGLMVHASLKSFGSVKGGATTVIEALMETVSPDGTLVMPSFNHGAPFEAQAAGYFQPKTTPTTNGAIPDTFWRMPNVYRTLNPTHAFAAWGKQAQLYTQGHHRTLTLGLQSPLGLLYQDDGYCLLIGVNYQVNTFHHVVEVLEKAPCLGKRSEAYPVILPNDRKVTGRTWGWRETPCPLTDEGQYETEMEVRGLHHKILVGNSQLMLFRLEDCFEMLSELLRTGKKDAPPCQHCLIRPRRVKETVASDWDDLNDRLQPDSESLLY